MPGGSTSVRHRRLIVDIEADALDPSAVSQVWCICSLDIDTLETFDNHDILKEASVVIGHNITGYDLPVLDRFYPGVLGDASVYDTLVLSRLLKYNLEDGNGHSLEAWGNRLGSPKHDKPDFTKFSTTLLEYCKQDVQTTYQLYLYLQEHLSDPQWVSSIRVEHEISRVCLQMQRDGFSYSKAEADGLKRHLEARLGELDKAILESFPARARPDGEFTPRLTKAGTISKAGMPRDWTDYTSISPGSSFTRIRWEEFNPGSPSQIVERLEGLWTPTVKTKSGKSYRICEENLASLKDTAPEAAKSLVERILVASRVRTLVEWEACYNPTTGRIHGKLNPIGTWTGRMSHVKPNLGNVAAPKSIKYKGEYLARLATDLGGRMRSLWCATDGWWLVGTDAESIQLRILAHYINDPLFTKALVEGNKEDGTDPHSVNGRILECSRDAAKTFVYAFILGAGDPKAGEILGGSARLGARRKRQFIDAYPGLRELKEGLIPRDAARGYFEGLDGRLVRCNDEHLMLAAYLQNGEAVIMKHANLLWRKQLEELGIVYRQLNVIHDEFVTEVYGTRKEAETAGAKQAEAIRLAAESLQVRCPMSGAFRVGRTWLEVH